MRRSTLCLSLTMLCATIGCSPRQSDRGDAAGNVTNETGTARSVAAANPADAAAATALARRYFALIEAGEFEQARRLWDHDGADAGGDAKALAGVYAPYRSYDATIDEPTALHTVDGVDYVNVGIAVDAAVAQSGKEQRLEGPIMLRRRSDTLKADAAGASDSRGWRIWGVDIRAPH